MKKLRIFLVLSILAGCQLSVNEIVRKEPEIKGEWRYFGTGWHNAYMAWNVDTFQFAKAPRVVFLKDGTVIGKTTFNKFQGTYQAAVANVYPQKLSVSGSLSMSDIIRIRTIPLLTFFSSGKGN